MRLILPESGGFCRMKNGGMQDREPLRKALWAYQA